MLTIASMTLTLFTIFDPVSNIALFSSNLHRYPPAQQRYIIVRELFFALLIILAGLFMGGKALHAMHLSPAALSITGGVIFLMITLPLIFPHLKIQSTGTEEAPTEPFIVPLATPFVVGPTSLATVIIFAEQAPDLFSVIIATITAWAAILIVLLLSPQLQRILGERGLIAFERLLGLILVFVSTDLLLSGIRAGIKTL